VQAGGVAISVLAIILLVPPSPERAESLSCQRWVLVPGIFALSGGTRTAQKMIAALATVPAQSALALAWFGAAAVFSIGLMARTGWPTRCGEWMAGSLPGVANPGCMLCVLRALDEIPATLVFPALSCLSLSVTTAGALLFWRECPTRRAGLGIAVGLLAVLLVGAR
jgi:drug/metabolite transporter (DMT)-like permease